MYEEWDQYQKCMVNNLYLSKSCILGLEDYLTYSTLQEYFNTPKSFLKYREREIQKMKNSIFNLPINQKLSW